MPVSDRLREHVIGLLDFADDDRLARVINMLERERASSPADLDRTESGQALPTLELTPTRADMSPPGEALQPAKQHNVAANLFGAKANLNSLPNTARGPRSARNSLAEGDGQGGLPELKGDLDAATAAAATGADGDNMVTSHDTAAPPPETDELSASQRAGGRGKRGNVFATMAVQDARTFEARVVEKSETEKDELRRGIEGNSLFSSLEPRDIDKIVMALDRQEFDAGVDILKQGEVSPSRFYLIFEGQVSIIKNGKNVAKMGVGQTFGELEMMYDTSEPNVATVRSVTDVALWWLDRPTYKNIVLRATLEKRDLYMSLINKVGFLEGMSDYDKTTLADALTSAHYRKDDYIIKFGEKGSWMHFIVEGTVQVVGRQKGAKVNIVQLGPGACVGELEFLFNHLTVADVIATGPVTTAKLSRRHFEMIMGPISGDLKRYIKSGGYDHYLKEEANTSVLEQLAAVEKKPARKTAAAGASTTGLPHPDPAGEVILCGDAEDPDSTDPKKKEIPLYRFPLKGVDNSTKQLMMAIREDGTIMSWNGALEEATKFRAADVIGQSIFSYLFTLRDQKEMNDAVARATQFAGDTEGFFQAVAKQNADADAGLTVTNEDGETVKVQRVHDTWTFARADGLTKCSLQFSVLPPVMAQTGGKAEIVLAVGTEKKRKPPTKETDAGEWLAEQMREELKTLSNATPGSEPPSARGPRTDPMLAVNSSAQSATFDPVALSMKLKSLLEKYESLQRRDDEVLHSVNVRNVVGNAVSASSAEAVANNNVIEQAFDDALPTEVYIDTHVFPDILRYTITKAAKHCKGETIKVTARPVSETGLDYFEVVVRNGGSSVDGRVLHAFKKAAGGNAPDWFVTSALNKAREGLTKIGGQMILASKRNEWTEFKLRVPLISGEDDADDDDDDDAMGGGVDMSTSVKRPQKMTFTTLVVETRPVHRNALNTALWDRKHAVMPANTANDVRRLIENSDIVIADPQQALFMGDNGISDPTQYLRNFVLSKAIVITSESFDDETREAYHKMGFFTLTKPFTPIQAKMIFRKAEEMVAKFKAEESKIEAMRDVFSGAAHTQRAPWEKGKLLGKGAFGEVYEAIDSMTGGKMAVKILRIGPKVDKKEVISEIETMCTLRHKNIIHYFYAEDATPQSPSGKKALEANPSGSHRPATPGRAPSTEPAVVNDPISGNAGGGGDGAVQMGMMDFMGGGAAPTNVDDMPEAAQPSFLHVFMEFAAGGTLSGRLESLGRGMEVKEMVPVLRDVVEGLAYVHSQRFVHCDIKSANVLFGLDQRAKLGDFGTARRLKEGEKFYYMQGTPSYMSPECMSADPDENIGYDFKTDIWSLGMMVLEMATGKPPLSHIPGLGSPFALTKYVTELADAPDLSIIFDAPPPLFEFIRACVDVDPDKRPSASQLLEFALFREDSNEDLASAQKALKRAQLLHLLNQFVAFQDPDDEDDVKPMPGLVKGRGGGGGGDDDSDGGFFSSDDDDVVPSDAELAAANSSATSMSVLRAGNVDDFFSSDDEEEPAPSGGKEASTAKPVVPEQGGDGDDEAADSPGPPVVPRIGLGADLVPHAPEGRPDHPRPQATPTSMSAQDGHANARRFTTAAVALHEALLNFLDRVSNKYGMKVDVTDARNRLKRQYEELRTMAGQHGGSGHSNNESDDSGTMPADHGDPTTGTTTGAPGAESPLRAPPQGSPANAVAASGTPRSSASSARVGAFQPDVAGLLTGDTELLSRISSELDAGGAAK